MFQETYKSAYDKIGLQDTTEITEEQVKKWLSKEKSEKKRKKRGVSRILRPAAVIALASCLILILGVPAAAQNIPGFYAVLERNAPALADYLIPVQQTDSSHGIVMNLEAARIEGNTAEVLVSFADEGDNDFIHGMVDMYDCYHMRSYGAESNVGGCSFIEYNEEEDKVYFKIDLLSYEGEFDPTRMEFNVSKLLTDCQSYTQEISLENIIKDCAVKAVSLNGSGGVGQMHPALEKLTIPGNEIDPRPGHLVMDIPLDGFDPNTMEIAGIAYMDGILRVQLFRGNFKEADRHMNIYMLDEAGNEIYPNMSVMWHEEVGEEEVLVDEFYFVIAEEKLETYTLIGEGDIRSGSIKGDWSIVFDVQ